MTWVFPVYFFFMQLLNWCVLLFLLYTHPMFVGFFLLEDAKVMSWWDYGYQITAMANRTILVDNNTWNNTHISRVGQVSAVFFYTAFIHYLRSGCNPDLVFWCVFVYIVCVRVSRRWRPPKRRPMRSCESWTSATCWWSSEDWLDIHQMVRAP